MGGKGFLRSLVVRPGPQRGALGGVPLAGRASRADCLALSLQTQAEGDALRPRGRRTALQEDPLPGRAGSLRDGTLAGLRGAAPRRWPSAGLGGAWTAAVRGPGGRLPSASEDGPRSRR